MNVVIEKEKQSVPAGVARAQHPAEYYLFERYKNPGRKGLVLSLYYALRPLIPRQLQLGLRRMYSKHQARVAFPSWPIEPILVDQMKNDIRAKMNGDSRLPMISFWPGGAQAAVTLTHDVEWEAGSKNIMRVREIEKKYGMVSSWNFVPERFTFDKRLFDVLVDEGCEIGVHGLHHDGKDFTSRAVFEERLPKMNAYLRGWNAVGFRSPATHRNPEWMPKIEAEYDSSFPDTDPFEPQAGGCCSIFPFFLKDMVELPITMPQDHTLFEILRVENIAIWREKASWIIENHGLVNIIIHPDYMLSDENLNHYEEFLKFITSYCNLWYALPREVARWWRSRSQSTLVRVDGVYPIISGPASDNGTIMWAEIENGSVVFRLDQTLSKID